MLHRGAITPWWVESCCTAGVTPPAAIDPKFVGSRRVTAR
jgi:hypothetical protein